MDLSATYFGFSLTNILAWFVFGILAGIIVHVVDRADVRGGILGAMILGIIGALVGGFLSAVFIGKTYLGFSWQGFVTAVIGAFILALLSRLLFRNTGRIKTEPTNIR